MKKWLLVVSALMVVSLLVVSCAAKAPTPSPVTSKPNTVPAPSISVGSAPGASKDASYSYDTINQSLPSDERMIVRNGNMSLVVKDVIEARDSIAQLAEDIGGYVVSSRIYGEEQDRRAQISIRVPDDSFEETLNELRKLSTRVDSESTDSKDVTEEYIDLEGRLKNAQATESQYLNLLDKAVNVEDILKIYSNLSQVRQEIESIKGRMQYLEQTSSTSLISINLQAEHSAKPLVQAGWSAKEVLKSAIRGFVTVGQWLGTLVLWLIIFIPIWGTILGIFLWQRQRRRRKA